MIAASTLKSNDQSDRDAGPPAHGPRSPVHPRRDRLTEWPAMILDNQTHWRTDHLRAFVERVAQTELSPDAATALRVRFVYRREPYAQNGGVTGHATLGTLEQPAQDMTIKVARWYIAPHDLAMTLAHEMAHLRGVEHPAMTGDPRYRFVRPATDDLYAWAWTLPLERAEPDQVVTDRGRARSRSAR